MDKTNYKVEVVFSGADDSEALKTMDLIRRFVGEVLQKKTSDEYFVTNLSNSEIINKKESEPAKEIVNQNSLFKVYKITKTFQGGRSIYYAFMPKDKKIHDKNWGDQFEEWGENTNGGHCYGYSIKAEVVRSMPKGSKKLYFNKGYFEAE